MKAYLHRNKIGTLAALVGLMALLLLSPCKVRNSVQTAFEIPQTEVSNKSVCQIYEDIETVTSVTKTTHQNAPAFIGTQAQLTPAALPLLQHVTTVLRDKNETVERVPYYILFQNLKVHCS